MSWLLHQFPAQLSLHSAWYWHSSLPKETADCWLQFPSVSLVMPSWSTLSLQLHFILYCSFTLYSSVILSYSELPKLLGILKTWSNYCFFKWYQRSWGFRRKRCSISALLKEALGFLHDLIAFCFLLLCLIPQYSNSWITNDTPVGSNVHSQLVFHNINNKHNLI